jgi:hypothetical protein
LFPDVIPAFLVGFKPGIEKIREEDQPENEKQYEKLDQDDDPEFPPDRHAAETIVIKEPYTF